MMSERVNEIDFQEETQSSNSAEREMSFWDHLEELRRRLIWSLIGIVIATIVCAIFSDFIVNKILLAPAIHSQSATQDSKPQAVWPDGSVHGDCVCRRVNIKSSEHTLPFLEIYRACALSERAKVYKCDRIFLDILFSSRRSICILRFDPECASIFCRFGSPFIENIIDVQSYFGFITGIILACGVVFELPMLSYFLARLGILSAEFLRKYRRHAVILILILAAAITPPDVVSWIMMSIPLYLLYEISIFVVQVTVRINKKGGRDGLILCGSTLYTR